MDMVHAETEGRTLRALEEQPIHGGCNWNARGTRAVSNILALKEELLQHRGRSTPSE
jgi:hypothetical protein